MSEREKWEKREASNADRWRERGRTGKKAEEAAKLNKVRAPKKKIHTSENVGKLPRQQSRKKKKGPEQKRTESKAKVLCKDRGSNNNNWKKKVKETQGAATKRVGAGKSNGVRDKVQTHTHKHSGAKEKEKRRKRRKSRGRKRETSRHGVDIYMTMYKSATVKEEVWRGRKMRGFLPLLGRCAAASNLLKGIDTGQKRNKRERSIPTKRRDEIVITNRGRGSAKKKKRQAFHQCDLGS